MKSPPHYLHTWPCVLPLDITRHLPTEDRDRLPTMPTFDQHMILALARSIPLSNPATAHQIHRYLTRKAKP